MFYRSFIIKFLGRYQGRNVEFFISMFGRSSTIRTHEALTKLYFALSSESSMIKAMLSALDLDLRHRSLILSKMGLLPKLYGHDISAVFRQKYHGNVTIVPRMRVEDSLGVKAIMNPTVEDMRVFLR